jgi:hypothetical protein
MESLSPAYVIANFLRLVPLTVTIRLSLQVLKFKIEHSFKIVQSEGSNLAEAVSPSK